MEKRYPRTIMATACIPWTEDFRFDEMMFRRGVDLLLQGGVRSIYLFGTAGEGYAVNREQYTQIVTVFMDEMKSKPDSLPMVGVISLSMSEIIERISLGLSLGVQDFQISFPSWGAVSVEEGIGFLKTVCTHFPQARFLHYNNGLRSKTRLSMKDYVRLSEEVPNLAAVKNPGISLYELHDFHSRELPIEFFNLEFAFGFASLINPTGLLISLCDLNLKRAWDYFEAGSRRDAESINAIHRELEVVDRIFNENIPQGMIDSAYDKLLVKYHLPEFSQRLYPPYTGVSDEQFNKFAASLQKALPGWAPCSS